MCDDYYLNVLQGNNFKCIRKLTNTEKETFFKASTLLNKLNIKLYFLKMVDYSYNELKNFEIEYNHQINFYPLSIDSNIMRFKFIRLLHNYLSSVTLFLNQYNANVKREYENELYYEYSEFRKDLYYNNLSYKIIYELQNEFRHSKIPSFTIKSERNQHHSTLEAKFYIEKNCLNNNKLKNDKEFQDMDELIDIYDHMENMNSYIFDLTEKILTFELDLHIEYYNFLKSLMDEITISGSPCIINYKEINESVVEPKINFIDTKIIEFIDTIKKL